MTSVTPLCPVYRTCGGCQYQHVSYPDELKFKEEYLKKALAVLNLPPTCFEAIVPSPQEYFYRNRLDLKLNRYKNGDIKIGFSPFGEKIVMNVEQCPIARCEINDFIPRVKDEAVKRLKPRYVQACLVIRSGDGKNPAWGGVGEGSLKQEPKDYFWTDITKLRIYYSLDTFFQANLSILPKVMDVIRNLPIWSHDALFFDLYGGVGLFGMCVSDLVKRVVLIEENPASIELASYNKDYNHLFNVDLYDGRVEIILPKLFKHYGEGKKIIMVDPPRAGLTKAAVEWINQLTGVEYLLYLSCHPDSLARNLKQMKSLWSIERIIPFDFFPKTRHVETLVVLKSHAVV